MKRFKMMIFILFICILNVGSVFADDSLVNIYLFHSDTCPHCAEEIKLLDELSSKYENIKIYKYEVNTDNNYDKLLDLAEYLDVSVSGVPFTVIGDKVYKGFSYENSKTKFMATIEYYSEYGYEDKVGKFLGIEELPTYKTSEEMPEIDEYINNYDNYKIDTIFGTVNTKNLALPVISILIGLVDGFNPCAMWVLLFLISMLIGMKDRRKMWILGITFLFTTAFIYLLFMLAWLNVAELLTSINLIRILIGIVAILGAIFNIYGYFKSRKTNGCTIVDDNKRNKIFNKIRKFTSEKSLFWALVGVITLAVSVNIVELACSAGLPVMFIEILSINNLSLAFKIIYISLYMISFLLDDLIIFFIAMTTMQVTGFSTKYGKLSKIIGGILLLVIGLLLIFKPEWIMFNF